MPIVHHQRPDGWASLIILLMLLIKQFLPNPQYRYCPDDTEHKICEIPLTKQLYVQQMADKSAYIAANDTDNKVHATSFTFAAHNAVGDVAY